MSVSTVLFLTLTFLFKRERFCYWMIQFKIKNKHLHLFFLGQQIGDHLTVDWIYQHCGTSNQIRSQALKLQYFSKTLEINHQGIARCCWKFCDILKNWISYLLEKISSNLLLCKLKHIEWDVVDSKNTEYW